MLLQAAQQWKRNSFCWVLSYQTVSIAGHASTLRKFGFCLFQSSETLSASFPQYRGLMWWGLRYLHTHRNAVLSASPPPDMKGKTTEEFPLKISGITFNCSSYSHTARKGSIRKNRCCFNEGVGSGFINVYRKMEISSQGWFKEHHVIATLKKKCQEARWTEWVIIWK